MFYTYQELYRSSWRGPILIVKNRSYCPKRAPKEYPGDQYTKCFGDRMGIDALARWKCELGTTYAYRVYNFHGFEVGRDRYHGQSWAQEGDVTCKDLKL